MVRVTYGDGIYYDIKMPIEVKRIEENLDDNINDDSNNTDTDNDNINNDTNSNEQADELNKPSKDEVIISLPNNTVNNNKEVINSYVIKTEDNNLPYYLAIAGLITSLLGFIILKIRKKK